MSWKARNSKEKERKKLNIKREKKTNGYVAAFDNYNNDDR